MSTSVRESGGGQWCCSHNSNTCRKNAVEKGIQVGIKALGSMGIWLGKEHSIEEEDGEPQQLVTNEEEVSRRSAA